MTKFKNLENAKIRDDKNMLKTNQLQLKLFKKPILNPENNSLAHGDKITENFKK